MFQTQRMCRIQYFPREEQVSPKSGQGDQRLCAFWRTLRVFTLLC